VHGIIFAFAPAGSGWLETTAAGVRSAVAPRRFGL
jgi:hypothetical protein